jgi:hypothetical protein
MPFLTAGSLLHLQVFAPLYAAKTTIYELLWQSAK